MKMKEFIEKLDVRKAHTGAVYIEDLLESMNLLYSVDTFDFYYSNTKLKSYYISSWIATGIVVGIEAYFLDDELVCLSTKESRKSDILFEFIGLEAYNNLKNYLLSFSQEEEDDILYIDLNEDMGNGIKHINTFNLLQDIKYKKHKVIYNGELVDFDYAGTEDRMKSLNHFYVFSECNIIVNGSNQTVYCSDVEVPYFLRGFMLVKEFIEKLDVNKASTKYVNVSDLIDYMNLLSYEIDEHTLYNQNKSIKAYYVSRSFENASIGIKAYFLDNEFMCLSKKHGLDYKEFFEFISYDKYNELRNYLLTFSDNCHELLYLDDDIGDGFIHRNTVSLLNDICNKNYEVIYKGERVKLDFNLTENLLKSIKYNEVHSYDQCIIIVDGQQKTENCYELTVPYF